MLEFAIFFKKKVRMKLLTNSNSARITLRRKFSRRKSRRATVLTPTKFSKMKSLGFFFLKKKIRKNARETSNCFDQNFDHFERNIEFFFSLNWHKPTENPTRNQRLSKAKPRIEDLVQGGSWLGKNDQLACDSFPSWKLLHTYMALLN